MKIVQKFLLQYFIIKLKLLKLVSLSAAGRSAFNLFCTPYSRRRTYQAPAIFEKAKKLTFIFKHHTIHGFEWQPEVSNGKKVLICHGFDSLSYKFSEYVVPLLSAGFTVYAFDAPAHGLSSGKTINALLYSEMLVEADNLYGRMNVVMAHSFGCIAVTLAVEKSLFNTDRLVLLAPATETTRSLDDFARHLKISSRLKEELVRIIINIGGQPPSWYSVARIVKDVDINTLWIHDRYDPITPFEDIQPLLNLHLPHVRFHITEGLGHSLYRNNDVAELVIRFIKEVKHN